MGETTASMKSEDIAGMLDTNAVVVRRTLALLRDAGVVEAVKGTGGGWVLTVPLNKLTLLDVYQALGEPNLFNLGMSMGSNHCLVEKSVNLALASGMDEARKVLMEKFGRIMLSDVASDVRVGLRKRKRSRSSLAR
jgi:DNA-binding IscR family transcriptional regulator